MPMMSGAVNSERTKTHRAYMSEKAPFNSERMTAHKNYSNEKMMRNKIARKV